MSTDKFLPMPRYEGDSSIHTLFAAFRRTESDFVAITPRYDGIRVEVHRAGDRVTIYTMDGSDITSAYPNVVREFAYESWPKYIAMEGYLTGWSGSKGYLSGKHVSPNAYDEDAKSFTFMATDIFYLENPKREPVLTAAATSGQRLFTLLGLGPSHGGTHIRLSNPSFVEHEHHLPRAVGFHTEEPSSIGVEMRPSEDAYGVPLPTYINPDAVSSTVQFSLVSQPINAPIFSSESDLEVVGMEGFEHGVDELPDSIEIISPLFPHGDLIDGTGKKYHYSEEGMRNAKLVAPPDQSVPIVNYDHDGEMTRMAGVMLSIWYDETKPFDFIDHTGRQVSGMGMVMQRSLIKEPRAIWSILHGNIKSVSAEPMFDPGPEGPEYRLAIDPAITGMALTNRPAIGGADISSVPRVCLESVCTTFP